MALIFPLSLADFLDRYAVADVVLDCPVRTSGRNQASGFSYTFEEADPLWLGAIEFPPMRATRAAGLEAVLRALEVPGRGFMCTHPRQRGPASDRGGALILAGGTSFLLTADYTAQTVTFQGMPSGLVLKAGDRFSVVLDADRVAMHEIQHDITVQGNGQTAPVQVWPYLRPGMAAGRVVDFVRPAIKAVIVPGTRNRGSDTRGTVSGIGFSFMQDLR